MTIPSGVLISANAVRVLEDILRAARLTRATVTSGRRTSTDQARIMYKLIERNGVSYAKNLVLRVALHAVALDELVLDSRLVS